MTEEAIQADVTKELEALRAGDTAAKARLIKLIYEDLQISARRLMRGARSGHTLQPTALVNELLLRFSTTANLQQIENRRHLIAAATVALKRLLIDHARARATAKRGGSRTRVTIDDRDEIDTIGAAEEPWVADNDDPEATFLDRLLTWYEEQGLNIVSLDEAIEELRELEPRWAEVVLLRFFGGYTIEETAELLAVSPRTVNKDWKQTRAWLRVRLEDGYGPTNGEASPDEGTVRGGEPSDDG